MPSLTGLALAAILATHGQNPPTSSTMIQLMERYSADQSALNRLYNFPESSSKVAALTIYLNSTESELNAKNYKSLSPSERADWHLMKIELDEQGFALSELQKNLAESGFLVPFLPEIVKFHDHRISRSLPNSEQFAADLAKLEFSIKAAHNSIRDQLKTKKSTEIAPEHVALRAVNTLRDSRFALENWHEHFAGYDPMFTWWTKRPYEDVTKALDAYTTYLRTELTGRDADPNRIVGDPVGREALVSALRREMIDYTPEELIAIAEKEMAWVDVEFKKAAKQLGYGDDWRAALEHVKTLHEKPGDQPKLIRKLAEEAIDYLEKNDLLTIPPLAKDVWRMDMMSPERQLVSPFFLGGESILISFPTDEMTHEQKLMSLRANNRYFAKATVHHELIPGHHMQFFMNSRYNTHRSGISNTPFWVEGWALYWEFLLYKRGFAATPEDKIGFLFWRKHRCARIIFSLKFHLSQMTAQECIDMLINVVGHEKSTAEGEVRRSFGGTYPPLYQAAYMLGAFQLWQIRRELVDTGKIPEKQFHDEVLKLGNMPWAVARKLLSREEIPQELKPWKFYNGSIN